MAELDGRDIALANHKKWMPRSACDSVSAIQVDGHKRGGARLEQSLHWLTHDSLRFVVVAVDEIAYLDLLDRLTVNESAGGETLVYDHKGEVVWIEPLHPPGDECLHAGDNDFRLAE